MSRKFAWNGFRLVIAATLAASTVGCGGSTTPAPVADGSSETAPTSVASTSSTGTPSKSATAATSIAMPNLASEFVASGPSLDRTPTARPQVVLKTERGDVTIELYRDAAPETVRNFLDTYVETGLYSRTIFHHVDPNFIAIAGGYDETFRPVYVGPPIPNESSPERPNVQGTIAMIRSPDDADSATSQFYFNLRDNPDLDSATPGEGYCVFGRVIKGLETLTAIASAPTVSTGDFEKVPSESATIAAVQIVRY